MKKAFRAFMIGGFAGVVVLAALSVCCFVKGWISVGVGAAVVAVIGLFLLCFLSYRGKIVTEFCEAVRRKDVAAAAEIAERSATKNLIFYPMLRMESLMMRLSAALMTDDIPKAKSMISCIRHGSGMGWYFRTAYYDILIKLDEDDFPAARREYEDFRSHNEHVEIYKEQLEVLDAVMSRLFLHEEDRPLPELVQTSVFPVVQRILGKHFDRKAEKYGDKWD